MNNAGYSRSIWLMLLKEGGRWTNAEIAVDVRCPKVNEYTRQMVESGSLVRYEGAAGFAHGVTEECMVPRGLRLSDITKAKGPL